MGRTRLALAPGLVFWAAARCALPEPPVRPREERARQIRSRIASLRREMVRQRREIDSLTKELITVELLCAREAPLEEKERLGHKGLGLVMALRSILSRLFKPFACFRLSLRAVES